MATQMGTGLIRALAACAALALLVVFAYGPLFHSVLAGPPESTSTDDEPEEDEPEDDDEEESEGVLDPLGPNAACYVCHMTFVFEPLARMHLPEKITCVKCHGVSAAHANDEDIGATKPDITFTRDKVDASCGKCHEEHDVKPREVVARWIEIGAPEQEPICTDCHGMHRIDQAHQEEED